MLTRRSLLALSAAGAGYGVFRLLARTPGETMLADDAGYGPLQDDPAGIVRLPRGFRYTVLSRTGETMSDGLLVPGAHDGMHAFPGPRGRTILVRNTGTLQGNPHNTTFTQKGFDQVTAMGGRNISLVAGALGVGVLPAPTGNVPTIAMVNAFLPEPGTTLQLLAGVAGIVGVGIWRSRRNSLPSPSCRPPPSIPTALCSSKASWRAGK